METLIILGIIGLGGLIWHEKGKTVSTPSTPVGKLVSTSVGPAMPANPGSWLPPGPGVLPIPQHPTSPVLQPIYSGTPIMSGPYTLDSSEHVVDASGVDAFAKREPPSVL